MTHLLSRVLKVNPIGKDPLQRKIEIVNWIILGVFVLLSLIIMSFKFALGVFLGGLICIVNFYRLHNNMIDLIAGTSDSAKS